MKNAVVLDFETIRDPRAVPFIPEKGPRDRTDPAEKVAFDSNYIMPCVAGFATATEAWSFGLDDFFDVTGNKPPEYWLLETIWDELARFDTVVTFNGFSFDIPLLLKRSWFHGVKPTKILDMRKYWIGNHVDVRMVLGNWDTYSRGNLDLYSALKLGERKTDGVDGTMVQGMWDAKKYREIHEYCKDDCRLTWKLFESLKGFYLHDPPKRDRKETTEDDGGNQ